MIIIELHDFTGPQLAMTYHKNFSTASDSIPLKNIQPCDNPDCLPPSLRRTEMAQHHNTASCGQETASPANTGSDNKSTKVQHKYYTQSKTISIITKSKLVITLYFPGT